MVELLAPAGSMEALIAAVENGANAVYLAGAQFGARAYANNFDEAALKEAVLFAHRRNVLVNVTVNTIVENAEMHALESYLQNLYEINVDAVLVQDFGVAHLARQMVPQLPLHASTQMSVHNLDGVLALQELGFTRVVLAREMSLEEIRYICENSTLEIETFMHGALCVCYSGQCLMSSMIGGRSGNRGRCAQPCRLPYTLVDEQGHDVLMDEAGDYLLSPRDLNTLEVIPDLIEAGVASLKIEGRMKKPEYVATVVKTYREAIDHYLETKEKKVLPEEQKRLSQIFNRNFTTAYLSGVQGREMMSDRRPNNRGLLVGRVVEYHRDSCMATVKLVSDLSVGDQLDFWVKVGGRVSVRVEELFLRNGKKLKTANAGMEVQFPVQGTVHPHDRIFKVLDAKLMEEARKTFKSGSPIRRIPITMQVEAEIGKPLVIEMQDMEGHCGIGKTDFIGEVARKRPLDEETVKKQVLRLGTSVFEVRELDIHLGDGVMVPVSEINEARRKATEALEAQRLEKFQRPAVKIGKMKHPIGGQSPRKYAELVVSVDSIEKVKVALNAGADAILFGGDSYSHEALQSSDYRMAWNLARDVGKKIYFNTPRILREPHLPYEKHLLEKFLDYMPDELYVHHLGTLHIAREIGNFVCHTDFSFISYNTYTLEFLRAYGVNSATLSPELTLKQVEKLAKESPLPLECIVDGEMELMVSEYCTIGSFLGGLGKGACTAPCKKAKFFLKDRKDIVFPLVTDQFCHIHILNGKKLSMLPYSREFPKSGVARVRIEGKASTSEQLKKNIENYRRAMRTDLGEEQLRQMEGAEITRGHYFRGIE